MTYLCHLNNEVITKKVKIYLKFGIHKLFRVGGKALPPTELIFTHRRCRKLKKKNY